MNLNYFVDHDIYAGLSGLDLAFDELDLGNGVLLRKTYAHLMSPFMMAFGRPEPGKAHPTPWKAALGGSGFDVTAELVIPKEAETGRGHRIDVTRLITALIRLYCIPSVIIPVLSNISFSEAAKAPDNTTHFFPFEVQPRFFPIDSQRGAIVEQPSFHWVKSNWKSASSLAIDNEQFRLAISALDALQFVRDDGLGLISLWGGLESLFSPAKAELRFRISALIASYLKPFGAERAALRKEIANLYDARSTVAHGGITRDPQIVIKTYDILRAVLIQMIGEQHVPTRTELEANLLGGSAR